MPWSQAQLDRLEYLWLETKTNAKDIGAELGFSKNAIIGKARRMGFTREVFKLTPEQVSRFAELWTGHAAFSEIQAELGISESGARKRASRMKLEPRGGSQRNRPASLKRRVQRLPKLVIDNIQGLNVPFMDLEPHHCRYATTDSSPHLFCGHPKMDGSSYCEAHHAVCHIPASQIRAKWVDYRVRKRAAA